MDNEAGSINLDELTQSVSSLLEREKQRRARRRRRNRIRICRRRDKMRASIDQLSLSIEVIKWCMVAIVTVIAFSVVILVSVVWQIGNEA